MSKLLRRALFALALLMPVMAHAAGYVGIMDANNAQTCITGNPCPVMASNLPTLVDTNRGGPGSSTLRVEPASHVFNNIISATTTTVKSGGGLFHTLTINTYVASATITVYDSLTGSGTKIATITLPSTITGVTPISLHFDVAFATGLTVVTSGSTDVTVAYQ